MPELSEVKLPKTINEALKILAYNDFFYGVEPSDPKTHINPHHKDKETIQSLAEVQYPWTEKQGKLAVIILKRYLTKFQKHKMDIKELLNNPKYDEPFRVINFNKSIEKYINDDEEEMLELKFPYTKKLVGLIQTLKNKRGLPSGYCMFNAEQKIWTIKQTDVTTYYTTLLAIRYDFKFIDITLLDDYDNVKKEIQEYIEPSAKLICGQVVLQNAPESMQEYWNKNYKDAYKPLLQVDALKNFSISPQCIDIKAYTEVGKKLAHHYYHKLWIDRKEYNRDQIMAGLIELECLPIMMPVTGEINTVEDIQEFWNWIKCFERHGIDYKQLSFGFDIKEPMRQEDIKKNDFDRIWDEGNIVNKMDDENFNKMWELHQLSKQFKYVDNTTRIIFVRNRIPRTLIKSKIKPGAALITMGGGYFSAGNDNLKRLLENLPKKLYYSDSQPSNWGWDDNVIIKL